MPNDALEYHDRTKHSPRSVRAGGRGLDFENKPTPSKEYLDLPTVAMADRIRPPQQPALAAVAEPTSDGSPRRGRPDLEALTCLCYYAAGITKTFDVGGRSVAFRAAATTGALYHVDLYVVCTALDGLEAGVYHFDPQTLSLDVLRTGEYRSLLAAATNHDDVANAPLSIVATSTWWRNAWKYEDRTFRHAWWDSGTTLANLLAVAHALDYRAEIVTGFADERVATLLGVDPEREAPLEIVPVGRDSDGAAAFDAPELDPIDPDTAPLSPNEKSFPRIHGAWRAGRLEDGSAVRSWRTDTSTGVPTVGIRAGGDGERISLEPVDAETASSRPLHETIRHRGSCREYDRDPISFRKLSTVLDRAVRGVPMDVRREGERSEPSEKRAGVAGHASREGERSEPSEKRAGVAGHASREGERSEPSEKRAGVAGPERSEVADEASGESASREDERSESSEKQHVSSENQPPLSFVDPYLIVTGVDGLESGTYHYHPAAGELERLRSGEFRQEASHLALDQRLGGDAAVCLYFLSDLEEIVDAYGDRGYRIAQLEAAVTAGRLYLATYAHRALGGTGLTFYDDLVSDFFAPRSEGQTPMFLYTIGRPA
ncbi:SagB/ThcOx family dehydrogenase [Natrarchaeobius oligotrophus]|uniref:SagB/ThcOx family dehydrogenase n=1 Tax=Natrarchaeobius oligotrophus TaxID=3455743 RepID=UPI001FB2D7A9|nr:SagB family peptide dehydrogenase [Natrarchaeobius chitinivorans]